ncbi:MAG TPA: hypothetical protein VHS96_10485 [Bacteroidia bacterium]|nr:hypothetical protein [Bacteroidia bacterium]
MMKFKVISATALLAACFCWSCSFNNVEDDLLPDPIDICDPADTSIVSFQDTIFPIFTKYCSNNANGDCHWTGAPTPKPDYTAYAGIKQKIDEGRIQARLFNQDPSPMPPSFSQGPQSLSNCEITLLQRWIAQGAPNN